MDTAQSTSTAHHGSGKAVIKHRIDRVLEILENKDLDTLLVLKGENRRYLSGFSGEDGQLDESAGALLITRKKRVLATDPRYFEQAQNEAPLYETHCYKEGLSKALPALAAALHTKRLAFESSRMTCFQFKQIQKALRPADVPIELVPSEDIVEPIRMLKSADEIDKIRRAVSIAESAFSDLLEELHPEMTEKEAAWALERKMRESGAEAVSFPIIVASGANSALPHAHPGDGKIDTGGPILFDWGARVDGYCSDISRTLFLGKPTERFLAISRTVLEAQSKAIDAIRAGVSAKDIDQIARECIQTRGFKGKFGHSLGHGTGLAIHEGPRLSALSDDILREGMVFTVEPGIYWSGWGGVRIENQVVVSDNGAEVLNRLETDPLRLLPHGSNKGTLP